MPADNAYLDWQNRGVNLVCTDHFIHRLPIPDPYNYVICIVVWVFVYIHVFQGQTSITQPTIHLETKYITSMYSSLPLYNTYAFKEKEV